MPTNQNCLLGSQSRFKVIGPVRPQPCSLRRRAPCSFLKVFSSPSIFATFGN